MEPDTRPRALEPGLLPVLRLYLAIRAVAVPVLSGGLGTWFGAPALWIHFLLFELPVALFLVAYTWAPWWRRRLGRSFLPLALGLLAVHGLVDKYLTLQLLTAPPAREMLTLLLTTRQWALFQILVLFLAWQYPLVWPLAAALALCLLDGALSLPFVERDAPLFPLYVTIVTGRVLSVTGAALALGLLMERQRRQRAALAAANRQLAQRAAVTERLAASQERNRLARELHDTLAHSLSGVTVQLEAVEALWELNAVAARRMLDQALAATRSGLTEARRALRALRASPLDDLGLPLAVTALAESVAARANLALELEVDGTVRALAPDVEQCVYRVAQEALTNVARHARATALRVALVQREGDVALTIADDGCGFDVAGVNGAHFGLRGLHERADMIGAALHVESAPERGTAVRFVVPATGTLRAADGTAP